MEGTDVPLGVGNAEDVCWSPEDEVWLRSMMVEAEPALTVRPESLPF